MKIVLATHNRDKVAELREILGDLPVDILTLDEFPSIGEIVEDGLTFEENALKKARAVSRATKLPSLADDSGLEVYYLNNRPGVHSSRYAGPGCTYADNVRKLLQELKGVPPRRRGARFHCTAALVGPGCEETTDGLVEGTITEEPRGTDGFGYDPLFIPAGYTQTYAELASEIKNRISHRARAFEKMKEIIARHVGSR